MVAAPLAVSILQYLLATNPDFAELTQLSEDSPELQSILGAVSLLTRGLLLVIVTPAVVQAVGDIVAGRPPVFVAPSAKGSRGCPIWSGRWLGAGSSCLP